MSSSPPAVEERPLSVDEGLAHVAARPDRERPLELEIGCGKGRFLLAAARRWPERDFLAAEHAGKLARLVTSRLRRQALGNARVIHGDARELVEGLAGAGLARVHVYCPDPWPKRRHAKHRLFAPPFPDQLAAAMAEAGELLFTTDHDPYFREVAGRLAAHPSFRRHSPDEVFADLPPGGFDRIFEEAGVPVARGLWERVGAG